jgi:TPR repeat protein
MVEDQDADAVFLLSRLYFRSNSSSDVTPDSVLMMQKALGIQIDNKKAHELLLQTVKADPENYCALYELGCDFLGGEMRTEAVNRNLEKADQYFQQALKYAQKHSDADYVNRIERQIEKYK